MRVCVSVYCVHSENGAKDYSRDIYVNDIKWKTEYGIGYIVAKQKGSVHTIYNVGSTECVR